MGITGGGHLAVTDLFRVGPTNKSDLEVADAETLHYQDRAAAISGLKTRYPGIGDFHEAVK